MTAGFVMAFVFAASIAYSWGKRPGAAGVPADTSWMGWWAANALVAFFAGGVLFMLISGMGGDGSDPGCFRC